MKTMTKMTSTALALAIATPLLMITTTASAQSVRVDCNAAQTERMRRACLEQQQRQNIEDWRHGRTQEQMLRGLENGVNNGARINPVTRRGFEIGRRLSGN